MSDRWKKVKNVFGALGFNRHSSTTLRPDIQEEKSVDSVYQILQQGKVLRRGEATDTNDRVVNLDSSKPGPSTECCSKESSKIGGILPKDSTSKDLPPLKSKADKSLASNIYVALYKFDARDKDDLELRVGDKIQVIKDKDETWWLGERHSKVGFFPAKFVTKMRPHERVYVVNKIVNTTDATGKELIVKKNQVVLVNPDWPIKKENQLYCRVGGKEGYISEKDLSPP